MSQDEVSENIRRLLAPGGQSRISEDDYIEGAPELIVEIAASTASYDLHDKLRAYRRNGVREYQVTGGDWFAGTRAVCRGIGVGSVRAVGRVSRYRFAAIGTMGE